MSRSCRFDHLERKQLLYGSPIKVLIQLLMYVLLLASSNSALTTTRLASFFITAVTFLIATYSRLVSFMCIAVVFDVSGQTSVDSPSVISPTGATLVSSRWTFKDGAYYCYCAYVLRISRYSGFLWVLPTNTGISLRG